MIKFDDIKNERITRIIIGKPSSFDVSVIFECEIKDAFSGIPITEQDVDEGVVFLADVGYVTISTLHYLGHTGIKTSSLYDRIFLNDLVNEE